MLSTTWGMAIFFCSMAANVAQAVALFMIASHLRAIRQASGGGE
jgi:hypothetical protein